MRNLVRTGILFFILAISFTGNAQRLDIVSWNITWFGHTTQYPPDDNLQEANVRKVLRHLDADLYALSEIVDTSRLRKVTDSLGSHFAYVVSPFCSGNTTGTGSAWLSCQKLAFIYDKNIFTNVSARGLMRNSATAYYNYASGRFPFMLSADVTVGGFTRRMNFILLHGKAGSTISDYERRRDATKELKDTLDAYYSTAPTIVLGDFNDALNRTICTSCAQTVSSYDPLIRDSTDGDHYISITLPLAVAGQTSMTNYPSLVDNHVISDELAAAYIPGSASVRTDVVPLVVQYGATTSDHYPIFSSYNINGILTSLFTPEYVQSHYRVFPNPVRDHLFFITKKRMNAVRITLTDMLGMIRFSTYKNFINENENLRMDIPGLPAGMYFLHLESREGRATIKIIK